MQAARGYQFWQIRSSPHFIQDDRELREYDRQALFREYTTFYSGLLQHAKQAGAGVVQTLFVQPDGEICTGYALDRSVEAETLIRGLNYLDIEPSSTAEAAWDQWKQGHRDRGGFLRITKKLRFVLAGSLGDIYDAGPERADDVAGSSGDGSRRSGSEGAYADYGVLEIDDSVGKRIRKGDVLFFPTATPLAIPVGDTRWQSALALLATLAGRAAAQPLQGWNIRVNALTAADVDIAYSQRCVLLFLATYRGQVEKHQEKDDIHIHQLIMGQKDVFQIEIELTSGLYRAFLQDTDPGAFVANQRLDSLLKHVQPDTQRIIRRLPTLFGESETVGLLIPPYSFRDALPGVANVVPKPFVIPELPRTAKVDAGTSERANPTGTVMDRRLVIGITTGGTSVELNAQDLTRHLFVCGGSGSGKSYLAQNLLRQIPSDVPYLIIDPVKDVDSYKEFKEAVKGREQPMEIRPGTGTPIRINPFVPPQGATVFGHSSLMARVFALLMPSTPMGYEYMLGMIREAFRRKLAWAMYPNGHADPTRVRAEYNRVLYGDLGQSSVAVYKSILGDAWPKAIPTFADVQRYGMEWLSELIQKSGEAGRHSIETHEHFKRWWPMLESTHPLVSETISGGVSQGSPAINWWELFRRDCIITLAAVTDPQESNALFALILFLLNEFRISEGKKTRALTGRQEIPLQHVTLIEEAHRVMPRAQRAYGADAGSSPEEESARQMSQMLAEIREYGEGILLAEQSPGKLVDDAIINTGSKVMKRTTFGPDIECLGASVGLSIRERAYLPRLAREEAIVILPTTAQPIYLAKTGLPRSRP